MTVSPSSLRYYLSGGQDNADPSASLGGERSSVLAPVGLEAFDVDGFDLDAFDVECAPRHGGGVGPGARVQLPPRLVRVHADLRLDAPIRRLVGKSLEITSAVFSLAGSDLWVDAPVRASVRSDLALDASVVDYYDQNARLLRSEVDPDLDWLS